MKGWKTWVGFALGIVAAGLEAKGYATAARVVGFLSVSVIGVGLGSKIEKTGK